MKPINNLPKHFYQNLGKLFYAIAAADNMVNKTEISELKKFVHEHWLAVGEAHGSIENLVNQIELIFDEANSKKLSPERCFSDFVAYKKEHKSLFTNDIKNLILKTASAMANAFSSLNKSELIILAKLDLELKK
ncbi:hypothetical protein WJN01_07235 [Flavobacteriaceae bacterium SZ-1-7]|uniref:hypothetical protein n=1 Tax=Tamlana sedimenti TaxID=3134126 RepID=UPI0031244D60